VVTQVVFGQSFAPTVPILERPITPRAGFKVPDGEVVPAKINGIRYGVFSREAAASRQLESFSIIGLYDISNHNTYREAIREIYGADLAEFNYFQLGFVSFEPRVRALREWLIRTSKFGDTALALEPRPDDPWGQFKASDPEMIELRTMFEELQEMGINVRVRFASEANLAGNPYSAVTNNASMEGFRRSARWFREFMPKNVRMVFSPLINTPAMSFHLGARGAMTNVEKMYERGVWDIIGGTIYSDPRLSLDRMFSIYFERMNKLDPGKPWQICELGGPRTMLAEVEQFALSARKWHGLDKIYLFAGAVNPRRERQLGSHGTIPPDGTVSVFRRHFIASASASQ
jgi:hypothetical protein